MKYPGFIAGSAPSQSLIADGEHTINWYVEAVGDSDKGARALYPTPGCQPYVTVADVGGRALWGGVTPRTFGVMGTTIYELFSPPSATSRGSVAADRAKAQIVFNGPTANQLLFSSGSNAYCYDLTTNVPTVVLTGEAHQIGMIDGYFLAFNRTNAALKVSPLDDGTVWDPTQFALRSAQPDPWVAMIVNAPDIWLLGTETGDVWVDKGTTPFPLAPRTGLTIPYGTTAPDSLATIGGSVVWLTRNKAGAGIVVQASGYDPKRISTSAVETAIANYRRTVTIDDAEALVVQWEGHTFYVLRFPSASATWAYDLTTGVWSELGKWNPARNGYDVWAPRVHCDAFGQHLVADASGTISTLDVTVGTEADGSAIRRLRRGPVLVNDLQPIPIHRFEIHCEAGLGLQTGQGSAPRLAFRASSDGGKTWGTERTASAGRAGESLTRPAWTRLGTPRLWVPEITASDPIPWRILEAYINNDGQVG